MSVTAPHPLRACPRCALIHRAVMPPPGHDARCVRCDTAMSPSHPRRALHAAGAFSLAALILSPAAMTLPVIEIERLGHRREATVWSGAVDLMAEGQPAVGLLVFVCSVLVPLLKIGGMFLLCAGEMGWTGAPAGAPPVTAALTRLRLHRAIDWIGRWGMLDVLLIAVLVAAVKLGDWVDVHPGPGALAFSGLVVLSLLASATFHPAPAWEEQA